MAADVAFGSALRVIALPTDPATEVVIGLDEVRVGLVNVMHSDLTSWSELVDPSGRVLIPTTSLSRVPEFGAVRRRIVNVDADEQGPAISGAMDEYALSANAPRGAYILRFGLRPGVADPGLAVVSWKSRSKIGLATDAGPPVRPGGIPIRIHAGLFFNDSPPPNPTVTATLIAVPTVPVAGPPAPEPVITLRDDGVAPDQIANDGTFVADFAPQSPGKYLVRIEASGQVSVDQGGVALSIPYVRSNIESIEVLGLGGGPASFVRPLSIVDLAQDDEPDGLWNRIRFQVPVTVTEAGDYRLELGLDATSGRVVRAEGVATLRVGSQTATASVPPSELYRLGFGGPFVIKSVELFAIRDGESRLVDAEVGLSQPTQTYDIYRFQRPPFRPVGPTVFTPGDSGGPAPAPYTVLRAEVPMLAAFAGHYSYTAQLTAHECETTVVWAHGQFEVTAQQVAPPLDAVRLIIPFDGSVIGQRGINGPYTLRSVAIRGIGGPGGPNTPGAASSVNVRLSGQESSEFLSAASFVGYVPMADCNGNGIPDSCDLQELADADLNVNGIFDPCEVRGCNPADIANTDGLTSGSGGGPDGQLDNGDFAAFFAAFFDASGCLGSGRSPRPCSAADIANTDGEVHPAWPVYGGPRGFDGGGPDGVLDNGDFQAFFEYFFEGCGLSGPSGGAGGGELMSRIVSLLGEGEESIAGINLGALPPAVLAQRIEMLRSLGRPVTVDDFKAVAPELFSPPESPDR